MGIKELATSRTEMYQLAPELIQVRDGWNVRIESDELNEHIRGLAESIASVGVQTPLTVYMEGDTPILTDGFCRLQAVGIANSELGAEITAVPVRTEGKFSNDADRTLSMLTRNSGRPLTLLEQSDVVARLIGFGWTEEQVKGRVGCSISHVKNLILLASGSDGIRKMIIQGLISASNAIEAIRKFGAKAEEALVEALKQVDAPVKKVTQKQLKKGINWKEYGPRMLEMMVTVCYSNDTKEVREQNLEEMRQLIVEVQEAME